jgi:dihydrofolate reductase
MRIVTYGGGVTLDGFLAATDGAIDWLHFSKDVQQVILDYWKDIDTILMGRKTYEVAVAQGRTAGKNSRKGQHSAKKSAIHSYVFSRTLRSVGDPDAELVNGDAAEFVRDLKRQPGKGICLMGGEQLAQSLLAADLVDQIGLNIHPILLGSGIPTFRDPARRINLTLTECRQLEGGCILAYYRVLHKE